jgi:hypothetical protein
MLSDAARSRLLNAVRSAAWSGHSRYQEVFGVVERSIAGNDLMRILPEVLEEVVQGGTVFLVSLGETSEAGGVISGLVSPTNEVIFALGPPQVLGEVLELIDEEYGWPHLVHVSELKAVSDLMPGYRRHPLIYRESDCLAMSISLGGMNCSRRGEWSSNQ